MSEIPLHVRQLKNDMLVFRTWLSPWKLHTESEIEIMGRYHPPKWTNCVSYFVLIDN